MKLLHLLMCAERGGCETDCQMICQELKDVEQEALVIGSEGPMSRVFAAAGTRVVHLNMGNRNWFRFIRPLQARWMRSGGRRHHLARHGGAAAISLCVAGQGHSRPDPWRKSGPQPSAAGGLEVPAAAPAFARGAGDVRLLFAVCRGLFCPQQIPGRLSPHGGAQWRPAPGRRFGPCAAEIGSQDRLTIGMVARLDAIKDHSTLLRAFEKLRRKRPAARLEFAGDGILRGALEKEARELGLGQSVRFLGMVTDIYETMKDWDIFAYATTAREGMGNALAVGDDEGLALHRLRSGAGERSVRAILRRFS